MITGINAMKHSAAISVQVIYIHDPNLNIVTVIVYAFVAVSVEAKRNSFQLKRNVKRNVTVIPGLNKGNIT